MSAANVLEDVEAAAIRHMDVEQHQIPRLAAQLCEYFVTARRFTHVGDVGLLFQKLLVAGPYDCMIVGDEYPCHGSIPSWTLRPLRLAALILGRLTRDGPVRRRPVPLTDSGNG